MEIATLGFALLAGVLSTLSPCVLPIIPVVLATAMSKHSLGVPALAAGLALSFTTIGLFIAMIGFSLGFDVEMFRRVSAVLLMGLGAVLLVPRFQARFAVVAGPIGDWTERRFGGFDSGGISGQFLVGLLLGAVWTPCVGPTLGAASLMAARGENIAEVAATMLLFGMGAAMPLMMLGLLSQAALMRWRGWLLTGGATAKRIFGTVLIAFGVLTLTGLDKAMQATLVNASPQWITDLTTRF